jgi:hypothetical protein
MSNRDKESNGTPKVSSQWKQELSGKRQEFQFSMIEFDVLL